MIPTPLPPLSKEVLKLRYFVITHPDLYAVTALTNQFVEAGYLTAGGILHVKGGGVGIHQGMGVYIQSVSRPQSILADGDYQLIRNALLDALTASKLGMN